MMEAASTSEASVNFYQTTLRNSLEDSHLETEMDFICSLVDLYYLDGEHCVFEHVLLRTKAG
jgi:hypothetical protein